MLRCRNKETQKGRSWARRRIAGRAGISLVEVMIASFLLLITFMGLATVYARGRSQMLLESDRRQATSILQSRLDSIRREITHDDLEDLHETVLTYEVDGRSYLIGHSISSGDPEPQASTITVTVAWNARVGNVNVPRTQTCTTILTRTSS